MKSFIILTSGRAGSTSLIDALAHFDDIAVPSKQIDCIDNEIFHPKFIKKYAQEYQTLSGITVTDELSLIEAFYKSNNSAAYCGFKSMPNRHQCLPQIASEGKIKIITIVREDIASTVASFIVAIDKNTWRRKGGKQKNRFTFGAKYKERVFSHLAYIVQSQRLFDSMQNCIHIKFEDLCKNDFCNEELNNFFQRPIKLDNPRPPVAGSGYVSNWAEFTAFIEQSMEKIDKELVI